MDYRKKFYRKIMPIATTEEEDKAGLDQLVHGLL